MDQQEENGYVVKMNPRIATLRLSGSLAMTRNQNFLISTLFADNTSHSRLTLFTIAVKLNACELSGLQMLSSLLFLNSLRSQTLT
jgi:hypothetical protein